MYKTVWMHPRSKHWHLLDYVIACACDQNDVRITRAVRGTGAFSIDHRLVRSIMNICLASKYYKKTNKKKYNIKSFQDPCTLAKLQESLSSCLVDHHSPDADVDQQWDTLKSAIHKACTETIGHVARKHQDWLDENDMEIQDLIDCKRNTFDLHLTK